MKSKGMLMLQGALYIILGILFLSEPIFNTLLLVQTIGWILVVAGVYIIFVGFKSKDTKDKIFKIVEGLLIAFIAYALFIDNTFKGTVVLVYVVVWSLIIVSAFTTAALFKTKSNLKWVAIVLNLIVLVLGIIALFNPILAAKIFVWSVGFQLIFTGINRFATAFTIEKK